MLVTLSDLLPFILGIAIVPVQLIILLLFLKDPQSGLIKGFLFLAGITIIRLLQGIIFGLILNFGTAADGGNGKGPIVSTLLLVLGILLLITAYKKIKKEPDPDADPPKWMSAIESASNTKAFVFGIQLALISPKLWVFILGAIGTISAAQLGQPTSFITFIVFVLLAQSLLLLLVLIRLILPKHASSLINAASSWLDKHNRIIVIVISLIFGVYFFYQGFYGLFL
jgi:threonine/homoserine/homoserine lactone efflux protein